MMQQPHLHNVSAREAGAAQCSREADRARAAAAVQQQQLGARRHLLPKVGTTAAFSRNMEHSPSVVVHCCKRL